MKKNAPHVLVLGAGFGGLRVCQALEHSAVNITVVDRQNHHLFQPLLYQVATAGLSATEVAQPVRSILAGQRNMSVVLGSVEKMDLSNRTVQVDDQRLNYDYLIIALGGATSYFGHPEWEAHAPGLKSLADAIRIRQQVLLAFEKAEVSESESERQRLMTMVVVGGGPTGVELAGAFAELSRHVLRTEFRRIDPSRATVMLIEAGPRILAHLPPSLSDSAVTQLRELGVDVRTSTMVQSIEKGRVEIEGERIEAETIVWAAGVGANALTKELGVPLDRAGRIKVKPCLSVGDFPEVFAIGDIASVFDQNGKPVPGVSPAAMQMANHVAATIARETQSAHGSSERASFEYWDKGTMATIGRSAAVAKMGRIECTGLPAWLAWLGVHIVFLVGFRNKLAVFIQWVYSYFTYRRGARVVVGSDNEK